MALLTLGVLIATALFVDVYSHLFDVFGSIAKNRLVTNPAFTFFFTPAVFWVSAYICRLYSPKASGYHLQAALDQFKNNQSDLKKIFSLLNFRLLVVKAISSLSSTLGGGALGKEGPSMHITAGVFAIFAQKFRKNLPPFHLQSWILAGSAVALTMVFNAPLAGAAFAFEKLIKIGRRFKESIFFIIISVAITTIIFHKATPTFLFHQVEFDLASCWKFFIITATISAILAIIVKSLSFRLYETTSVIKSNWWHLVPIIIGLTVAYLNYHNGIYSFSGGIQTIEQTLKGGSEIPSDKAIVGRMVNTILTFGSGSAGGLIAPGMAIGIGIGSILSNLASNIDVGVFLLIGMTSFLAIMIGEPLAAALITFEAMGQSINSLPFFIAAAFIAKFLFSGFSALKKRFS